MTPTFRGGANVAMKLPKARFEETVAFYRDTLGMDVVEEAGAGIDGVVSRCASVRLGPVKLWLDQVDNLARADLWLELFTDDVPLARRHLAERGIHTQDELEAFAPDMDAHWINNPANIVHLVRAPREDE